MPVRLRSRVGPFAAALFVALALACEQAPQDTEPAVMQPAAPSPADALLLASARVGLPPDGMSIEDLPDPEGPGAAAVQLYCTACHALPHPSMHSATDWPSVARRMWLRMGLLGGGYTVPEPEMGQRIVLLDYLTANALQVAATLPDAPGREAFIETCGQCHELPDPRQHNAQDWFVVVRRMNQHMEEILGVTATSDEVETIVQYLTAATTS
jgi:cytochrome c5